MAGRLPGAGLHSAFLACTICCQVVNAPAGPCSYEFIYKQAVATTDAFLGMGGKHPGSHCCEDVVIRMQLPAVKTLAGEGSLHMPKQPCQVHSQVTTTLTVELDLDLQEDKLLLRSPQYYLALDLPHQVSEQHSKALWDSKKHQLEVSMRIVPLDFQPDFA